MVVSEHLQEHSTIGNCARVVFDYQRVQAAAIGDCHGGELHKLSVVRRCRDKSRNSELLQIRAPKQKLAKRPLLQIVIIMKASDCKLFEAFVHVDCAPEVVN